MRTRAVIAALAGVWLAAGPAFGLSGTDSRSEDEPQGGLHPTQSGEVGAPASVENRSGSPSGGSSGEDASRPGAAGGAAPTPGLGTPGAGSAGGAGATGGAGSTGDAAAGATGGAEQQGGAATGGYGPSSSAAPTATTGGQDLGTLGETVSSPQYWVGDAALFVDTALRAATVVTQELRLSTPAPRAVASQVQYLTGAIQRAVGNLRSLQTSAAGKAAALSAIGTTLTPLQAALDEASQVAQSAAQGPLAQADQDRLRSVVGRLQQAQRGLASVARAYNAEALVGTTAR